MPTKQAHPDTISSASANPSEKPEAFQKLLGRSDSERAKEYRYRFGQIVVFGMPVIALQIWGASLGGPEAARWVGIMQLLLTGWIIYVAAAGLLFEGIIWLAIGKLTGTFVVGSASMVLFFLSAASMIDLLFRHHAAWPTSFHWIVLILAAWCALQWTCLARRHAGS